MTQDEILEVADGCGESAEEVADALGNVVFMQFVESEYGITVDIQHGQFETKHAHGYCYVLAAGHGERAGGA